MTSSQIQMLIGIGVYLLFALGVGLWYAKKSNSGSSEYFLGGRGLGSWVAAMSAEASDMSGWLLMGLPGVAYFTGMGEAAWTAIGLAIGTYLNWKLVATRLRKYSQVAGNSITLPDYFSNRFRDRKKLLMIIASLIILLFFSIYVGSQFVTFGKLFSYLFGTQSFYTGMVVLGAVFVLCYTLIGGFLAESMTDFIQGILMFVALLVVLGGAVFALGGFGAIADKLSGIPRFTDILGIATPLDASGSVVTAGAQQAIVNGTASFGPGSGYSLLNILSCMAWGLGYFGMPQVLLRFMAVKKSKQIKKSRIIAVTWCVISLVAAVAIGLLGRALLPTLLTTSGDAEKIFIELTVRFFPPILAGLVLSGILAASMSSSDSYMLIASSAIAKNLFGGLKKNVSDKAVMWVARISLLVITLFGIFVALSGNDSIFRIVSYAWAGFGAAFGPLILFSLFWKRINLPGAVAGMVSGGLMVILWKEVIAKQLGGVFAVYELLPAFLVSCLFIVIVSLLTAPPSKEITDEFDAVKTADI